MASLGHVAVGMAAGRLYAARSTEGPGAAGWRRLLGLQLGLAALALLPDADVIAFRLGIPYAAPFGHRGASHSLLVALCLGLCCSLAASPRRRLLALALCTAVALSHGLLDSLTDGGLGVALLWPWDQTRYFAPWRPLPVAPIGRRLLSARGLRVMTTEFAAFLPFFVYALWPRPRR